MIIDAHVHVKGGDVFRREFDPDAIVARMDEAGIDRSCVFSICLPSYDSNELTRRAVQGRDRLIPFAHVVAEEGIAAKMELERIELAKVRAYIRDATALEKILGDNIEKLLAEVRINPL